MSRARYHVKAWYSWADVRAGRYAIDQDYETRAQAIAAGRASDCPLVDVSDRQRSNSSPLIAERETLMHPQHSEPALWRPRRFHVFR